MNYAAHVLTIAVGVGFLAGVTLPTTPAKGQSEHTEHETLGYNENVVKKLLEKTDPDVAFLARVKMMQGHLNVAIDLVGKGDLAEASQHIVHPVAEIVPDIVSELDGRHLEDPTPALNAIVQLLNTGKKKEIENALYDALTEMSVMEFSIEPSKMVFDRLVADTAVLLLRTAVMEYNEAFKDGEIINIVEYHDGSAFVDQAATLILDFKYEWSNRNPEAFNKLDYSLKELQTAWPSDVPPPKAVIPLSKMLSLVTIIDEQIAKMKAAN